MKPPRMHPDGVAALVAAIVAEDDVDPALKGHAYVQALQRALDHRQEQVLTLASRYYRIHPCDFDNSSDWRTVHSAGRNNLAKLDRANLRSR